MNDATKSPSLLQALSPALQSALAQGMTIVTPNKRLARSIAAAFDAEQHRSGRGVWESARVLPWNAWLHTLWLDALGAEAIADPPRLLTAHQSAYLWRRLALGETRSSPLIDARGAALLAAEAWRLVHAWGASSESWRGWSATMATDDAMLFARWAERFVSNLAQAHAVDIAQAADAIGACASRVPRWRGRAVMLAGFIETTPQQERLHAALTHAGMTLLRCDTLPAEDGLARRASAATPRDELVLALSWARVQALDEPLARIAIAVDDLPRRRAEVLALAEDVFCPSLQWPGRESASRPYNLSYGEPLAQVPMVATAIDLVTLMHGSLTSARAAALVRSPYLSGSSTHWMARAAVEKEWIEHGQREMTLDDLILAVGRVDGALAERWRKARTLRSSMSSTSPGEWVAAWQAWLAAMGWPGERSLQSAEYQSREAWEEVLAQCASLQAVEPRMHRAEALQALRAVTADTLFQPEAAAAPIHILGLLEAAGQPFDHLWVTGLAAERWPAAPKPHPFIPVAWQRERGVPHATAARELEFAREVTAELVRAAPDVVMSHAVLQDEHERAPSALIASFPEWRNTAVEPEMTTVEALFRDRPPREQIGDDAAPAIAAGTAIRGGAGLISAQSDCPFRAVANHRLNARPWPMASEGLTPRERGILVHAALAAFWRDVRDQTTLKSLPDPALLGRVEAAVAAALANALSPSRWRRLPPIVAIGERSRLVDVVRSAIRQFDWNRPPFVVRDVELQMPVTLSGLTLRLFLDRVDQLEDGGIAIVDYKGGDAVPQRFWFDERPQGPQLALYAIAAKAVEPEVPIRAVAYAQLKAGEQKLRGLAADSDAWPELMPLARLTHVPLADWNAVETHWHDALNRLAAEIAAGRASVAPRHPITCRTCGLQPLCRIDA